MPLSGNRQVLLTELPEGDLRADHFSVVDGPVPIPSEGEVLCRTILLSIDPANRAWMLRRSYRDQVVPGDVMAGFTISEVVDANGTALAPGTLVSGEAGWQELAAVPAERLRPVTPHGPLTHQIGALGVTGMTAYFGLLEVGRPEPGETVVVSAAAGAVGGMVGQLAKLSGCRAVGIAGSAEKCELLRSDLGFDAALNRRSPSFKEELRAACPEGIDVYFDNTGGPILDAILPRMNHHGTVVCCGVVSLLEAEPPPGPKAVPALLVTSRLRMEGFIVLDYEDRWDEAQDRMAGWIGDGSLVVTEDVTDGLEHAPAALVGVLAGDNVGKRIIRVGRDPAP